MLDHCRYQFRRVLKVSVHRYDRIAFRVAHACGKGGLMAEAAGESNTANRRVELSEGGDPFGGPVPTAIVDEEDLAARAGLRQREVDAPRQFVHAALLVPNRYDDADEWILRPSALHGEFRAYHVELATRATTGEAPSGYLESAHERRISALQCRAPGSRMFSFSLQIR